MSNIPYKIYLEEKEVPTSWFNIRSAMKNKSAPLLNPGTHQPMAAEELAPVFCEELISQELDNDTEYFEIPKEVLDFYRMFRPSPLIRAYFLEKALGTPAHIYYKFEGNNTSGSHKLNSAIAQAYYAKSRASRVLQPRPVQVSGVPLFPWHALTSISTVRYIWLKFPTSRSRSAAKS